MDEYIQDYIRNWLKAMDIERQEQQALFQSLLTNKHVLERVRDGFTWYPLSVKANGYALGEIPFIIVERQESQVKEDQMQSGKTVRLFSMQNGKELTAVKGIIHYIQKRQAKVFLHADEVPDELLEGKLGMDLLHDEQTFKDMQAAMKKVMALKPSDPLYTALKYFYGFNEKFPAIQPKNIIPLSGSLNESQNTAVNFALVSEGVSIIHGPPGTGKTTTLIQLIRQLLKDEKQVLVTAPSNAAVDLLTALIHAEEIPVVRLGHLSRIDPEILECSLESQVLSDPDSKQIKKVRLQADEYRKLSQQYKRSFGYEERQQRKRLKNEARELSDWAKDLEERVVQKIVEQSRVITCTFTGANSRPIRDLQFKTCIIDEASQALQAASWIPILKSERVILAGDPFQLPPTVKSIQAARLGLSETLLDLAIKNERPLHLLDTQYRMNNVIMGFSNQWFYKGALKAHESVADHVLPLFNHDTDAVITFIDTAGCGFTESINPETRSYFNKDEYLILREHLDPLLHQNFVTQPNVGILSPYKAQVHFIKDELEEDVTFPFPVNVQTIDSFQGQERDIIYISLVRSNDSMEIGFLKDYRRMNVAMTRARKHLVIIGDSATIGNDAFYQAFLEYVEKHGAYRSAWEWIQ
ncbi:MAG: AAA family ATPase [Saprospiraceae bacterium]|nr:AAA family ATPase [Saprospiraceae bacterium]